MAGAKYHMDALSDGATTPIYHDESDHEREHLMQWNAILDRVFVNIRK